MPSLEHSIEVLDDAGASLDPEEKFLFVSMAGQPQLGQQVLETWKRPGIDGPGFRKVGKHGIPFQLITMIDVESLDDGRIGYQLYLELSDQNPCRLVKDDVDWGIHKVTGVELLDLFSVANMQGGYGPISSPSYASNAQLICRWSLDWIADPG